MPKNDGKDAEAAWLRIVERTPKTVVERFWDQRDLRGRNGGRAVGDFPKPADFLIMQEGIIKFAEVKSVQSNTSFSFSGIRTKQRTTALRLAKAASGHLYVFFIFSFGLGQWFTMDGTQFAAAIDADRASLKFSELSPWK